MWTERRGGRNRRKKKGDVDLDMDVDIDAMLVKIVHTDVMPSKPMVILVKVVIYPVLTIKGCWLLGFVVEGCILDKYNSSKL